MERLDYRCGYRGELSANRAFPKRIIMNWRQLLIVTGGTGLLMTASAMAEPEHGLGKEMQAMGGDFKVLSQQINDAPSNESSLKLVSDLEMHTLAAKGMLPNSVNMAPEADKPKMAAKYRGEIAKLLQQELDLEQALLENDNAKAADLLNKIHDTERQGHQDFRHRR
jgi:Cytochrome b562